jgi:hypothetical protein
MLLTADSFSLSTSLGDAGSSEKANIPTNSNIDDCRASNFGYARNDDAIVTFCCCSVSSVVAADLTLLLKEPVSMGLWANESNV